MHGKVLGIAAGVGWLLFAGCSGPKGPQFDPRAGKPVPVSEMTAVETANQIDAKWLQPPDDPFTLGPGDRLEIEIIGDSKSRAITTVGPDGKIYYSLLPGMDVWGLTLSEAKALLENEMGKFVNAVQVGLTLRSIESKRVWLLGRFQNAGIYTLAGPTTLLETISLAGGTLNNPAVNATEVAGLDRSFVIREGNILPVNFRRLLKQGDMSQNIYLRSDDFVYLPSAGGQDVYVLGAVRAPQPIPHREGLSLVSVVAAAGGTLKEAYLSHVAIVRGSLNDPHVAIVDLKAIVTGEASDVLLEPADIVYVPLSPYRILARYVDLILSTFVRAVAVNEGARIASDTPIPVGVNIGIGSGGTIVITR